MAKRRWSHAVYERVTRLVRGGAEAEALARHHVFSAIFRENAWGNPESKSGPGSTLEYTVSIRRALPGICASVGAKTVLDIPCGDFNWMQHVDLGPIEYIGGDIVEEIVRRNQRLFGSDTRRFQRLDLAASRLPAADVLLCRDCLMHLPIETACASLRNIARGARIRYLLTSNFPGGLNQDVAPGDWFKIDLTQPPFGFPEPLVTVEDWIPPWPKRHIALWRVADLPITQT